MLESFQQLCRQPVFERPACELSLEELRPRGGWNLHSELSCASTRVCLAKPLLPPVPQLPLLAEGSLVYGVLVQSWGEGLKARAAQNLRPFKATQQGPTGGLLTCHVEFEPPRPQCLAHTWSPRDVGSWRSALAPCQAHPSPPCDPANYYLPFYSERD